MVDYDGGRPITEDNRMPVNSLLVDNNQNPVFSILGSYGIMDIESSTTSYYGFQNTAGEWYIMKKDSSSHFTYSKGSSGYSTAWTNRASQSYADYATTFG